MTGFRHHGMLRRETGRLRENGKSDRMSYEDQSRDSCLQHSCLEAETQQETTQDPMTGFQRSFQSKNVSSSRQMLLELLPSAAVKVLSRSAAVKVLCKGFRDDCGFTLDTLLRKDVLDTLLVEAKLVGQTDNNFLASPRISKHHDGSREPAAAATRAQSSAQVCVSKQVCTLVCGENAFVGL